MAPALQTRYVFSLAILIGAPIVAGDFGYGVRRIIPILGGEVRGEGIKGTILPYGADFQTIRPNGFTELEAKYAFEMDDGAIVYIENVGIRFGPVAPSDRSGCRYSRCRRWHRRPSQKRILPRAR